MQDPITTKGDTMFRRTRKSIIGVAAVAAIASAAAAPQALAGADYGPSTCLEGFVWRGAFTGDRVCVTRATYNQTQADNAAAASRRNPNGAYGPDTCLQGFIWRLARSSDRVCVARASYNQAQADNAAAASRRNSVKVTAYRYNPNPTVCDGQVCTTTATTPRIRIVAEQINVGRALVRLYRANGTRMRSWYANAVAVAGRPGGRLELSTTQAACPGQANAYFQVRDPSSGRWSLRRWVSTGCYS